MFPHDPVCWAGAVAWQQGPGDVSWAKLALHCELSPPHISASQAVRDSAPSWGEGPRATPCVAAGHVPRGSPTNRCCSLLLFGGCLCVALRARPYFTAREEMVLQPSYLALHCWDMWLKRLRAPARLRPVGGRAVPHGLFPSATRRRESVAAVYVVPPVGTGAGCARGGTACAPRPTTRLMHKAGPLHGVQGTVL